MQPNKKEDNFLVTPQKKTSEIFQDWILIIFPQDFCFSFSKKFISENAFKIFVSYPQRGT
jgi:hypothetical protein